MKRIDKQSRIPLYLQLMDIILNKIENGDYAENEKLPSERELCEMFDLSRITVRQTFQELEREGHIYKQHGKGTFVAPKLYNQSLYKLYSFTEEMKKIGKIPTTKVLEFELVTADQRLAAKMGLSPMEEVYKVIRLRLANEEPLMYEVSYLPTKLFPGLTLHDLSQKPMYEVFNEKYNIGVNKATERFVATLIRKEEASFLGVPPNGPGMLIRRYAYFQNELIEYTTSIARGDKFNYMVELT
ncbi:GntR family transcriptional regulator [Bacillus timonensis]|uniref:GntR family transcriptional regulator n=1 Tax=Bacillus timonensis TaxID=1033734 RepID=UPI000289EFFD|nr:GntR family transcriptional regulator [Bacillus timonensis]